MTAHHEEWDPESKAQLVMHGFQWSVVTDAEDRNPVFCLRVADHGQLDVRGEEVLKVLIEPEMMAGFIVELGSVVELAEKLLLEGKGRNGEVQGV